MIKYINKRAAVVFTLFVMTAVFLFLAAGTVHADEKLKFTEKIKTVTAGDTLQLSANKEGVVFMLSNDKATVDAAGRVTTKKYGKVRITATDGLESTSYVLTIKPKAVIGIDPGHQDRGNYSAEPIGPGASEKKTAVAGGTSGVSSGKPEYMLAMEIGKKLKKELINRGYRVVMTRNSNEVDITNMERALLLNKECDVAVRLHADGSTSGSANGASALYPSPSNAYVGGLSDMCKNLSECVLNSYCEATGLKNRGLVLRDDLTGTNWSTIPVTLIELGFMTNVSDDDFMSSEQGQKKMVEGLANGIDQFF